MTCLAKKSLISILLFTFSFCSLASISNIFVYNGPATIPATRSYSSLGNILRVLKSRTFPSATFANFKQFKGSLTRNFSLPQTGLIIFPYTNSYLPSEISTPTAIKTFKSSIRSGMTMILIYSSGTSVLAQKMFGISFDTCSLNYNYFSVSKSLNKSYSNLKNEIPPQVRHIESHSTIFHTKNNNIRLYDDKGTHSHPALLYPYGKGQLIILGFSYQIKDKTWDDLLRSLANRFSKLHKRHLYQAIFIKRFKKEN